MLMSPTTSSDEPKARNYNYYGFPGWKSIRTSAKSSWACPKTRADPSIFRTTTRSWSGEYLRSWNAYNLLSAPSLLSSSPKTSSKTGVSVC